MPLSEEELRLLEQMERALVAEDPKLASTLRGTSFHRAARRRAIIAGLVFVAGIVVLMTGAVMRIPLVGVIGFVIMLLSATVALTAIRGRRHAPTPDVPDDPRRVSAHHTGLTALDGGRKSRTRTRDRRHDHSFMERMEARWRRRREGY